MYDIIENKKLINLTPLIIVEPVSLRSMKRGFVVTHQMDTRPSNLANGKCFTNLVNKDFHISYNWYYNVKQARKTRCCFDAMIFCDNYFHPFRISTIFLFMYYLCLCILLNIALVIIDNIVINIKIINKNCSIGTQVIIVSYSSLWIHKNYFVSKQKLILFISLPYVF